MFQQQQPPQQIIQNQQQRKEHQQFISAENQAREKLNHYVFEYLMHIGAIKSANEFKNEVLGQTSNGNTNFQIDSQTPGFLFNWFSVFWDLYSAHPDKKDRAEPSNDAKSYHKMMFPPNQFPEGIVNGGIGIFGPPGGFPNPNMPNMTGHPTPDGMFPGAFFGGPRMMAQPGSSQSNQASPIPGGPGSRYTQQATRSGAPTPVGIGNNFPPAGHPQAQIAMNDQHMRLLQQQRQAQAVQQGRLAMNLPPAPAGGPHGKQIRPQFGPSFMGSPSGQGTPPSFSNQNVVAHNGGGGGTLMSPNAAMAGQMPMTSTSGPIMQQQQNDGGPMGQEAAARFMMASGNIQSQFMNHHEAPGSNGASNAGPGSVSAGGNGNIGIGGNGQEGGEVVPNNGGGNETGGPNSQLHSLLNGTTDMQMEMKQSPVFNGGNQQSGMNGGTPLNAGISIGSNAGAAGPGSVHSQCSGTNSQQHQAQTLQTTPISAESMDIGLGTHQSDEISKIKANLLEGFATNQ